MTGCGYRAMPVSNRGTLNIKLNQIRVDIPTLHTSLFRIAQWELTQGSKVLIQGASGRGKTTFLHLIAGLFAPTEGTVLYDGENIKYLSDDALCRRRRETFGIVFQKLNLLEHLTAEENVFLALRPEERGLAQPALEQLGLGDKKNVRAGKLSMGEQQRVAVARVRAKNPSVILADEPTSSLDDANAERVMKSLISSREDQSLVVVSHDARIRTYFDRVVAFSELVSA